MIASPSRSLPRRLGRTTVLIALGGLLLASPADAASQAPSGPFGVVVQSEPTEAELAAMREGGVGTLRWLLYWPSLQPDPGAKPDFAETDRIVAGLAKNHIQPVPMVHGSPCFVVDCTKMPSPEANSQPPLGSDQARLAWASFLGSLVDRYGPDGSFWSEHPSLPHQPISTWQIWNEQNAPVFYRPAPSVEGYAELLRISAGAIRSRDPDAELLLGGMFGSPHAREAISGPRFLEQLYLAGASPHFDGVAVHPYSRDIAGVKRQILEIRRVIEEHGDAGTLIWVTELGWASDPTEEGKVVETVEGQAQRLEEAFRLFLANRKRWNVASVLWFSWRDVPAEEPVCGWCHSSGLLEEDLSLKPAWLSYTELSGGAPGSLIEEDDPPPLLGGLLLGGVAAVAAVALWRVRRLRARRR